MKNLLLFSVFTILALAEFSCNKSELTTDSYDFEKAGQIHNAALDYLTSKIDVSKASKEEIYAQIVDFSVSQFKGNKVAFRKELLELEHKDYSQYCCEIDLWLKESKTRLNEVEHEYINKMVSTFKDMKINPSIDFAEEMLVLQKNVVADKRAFRKEMLVNTFSIAKYSNQYWKQANEETDHPYNHLFQAKSFNFPFTTCQLRDIIAYNDSIHTPGTSVETATNEAAYQSAICQMP
jgi:hypothetical protein